MINYMSKKLTIKLLDKKVISKKDNEIYEYGAEVFISLIINLAVLFLAAILINKIVELVTFLIFFCVLRHVSGGYHAKTHLRCLVISLLSYIVIVFINNFLSSYKLETIIICTLFSIIMIFKYAPVENVNKPLSNNEIKKYKKRSRIIIILQSIVILTCYFVINTKTQIYLTASLSILIQSLTLIPVFKY